MKHNVHIKPKVIRIKYRISLALTDRLQALGYTIILK
jgi:hypothetical protein